ncbi:hypothetical protein ACROYT_G032674 [Oculina patagonica]
MPDTDPTSADAEWKKIQQNTFTRWCNEHLKCLNEYIYNLETDLVDGLKLIALLQVLSHKKIARFNKKPSFRPQKMENITIALKFIESENIRLVNIDSSCETLSDTSTSGQLPSPQASSSLVVHGSPGVVGLTYTVRLALWA